MRLSDFQVGQTVVVVEDSRRAPRNTTVAKVGRKYVTLSGYRGQQFYVNNPKDPYLIERSIYGAPAQLYPSEEAYRLQEERAERSLCMGYSLCNRCDNYGVCGLNYDGKPCRKLRTVEPTNYDRIMDMDTEQLAKFLASHKCPTTLLEQTCCWINDCTACWLEYLNEETKEDLT